KTTEHDVQKLKQRLMSTYDVTADGKLQIQELAHMLLAADENFLLLFRREVGLNNSVDFMKIWRKYDVDSSGCISAQELKAFLRDLFQQQGKEVSSGKLEEYTNSMASSQADRKRDFEKIFRHYDVNKTGALEGVEVDGFVKDMMELVR
ncbi:hypothetical protein CRUP_013789, partial [Coryphaenoides rupestris]